MVGPDCLVSGQVAGLRLVCSAAGRRRATGALPSSLCSRLVAATLKPLMTRRERRSTKRSLPVRCFLRLYEVLASSRLAVVMIFLFAVILGWATYVEDRYGTEAVHFGIYGAWWFASLMGLLGLNVLCAALIRFPWKKHQTGFLITHAGILVLLVGCLVSSVGGLEALLWVFEEGTGRLAYQETRHFELKIHERSAGEAGRGSPATDAAADVEEEKPAHETIEIPFVAGPFNWDDYRELSWFPWRWIRRDRGVLYDRDGITLKLLDYYSDSELVPGSPLRLRVKSGSGAGESGSGSGAAGQWESVELPYRNRGGMGSPHGNMAFAARKVLPGGERIVFWVAADRAEAEAFRDAAPVGPLGEQGQVVLHTGGQKLHFLVEQLEQESRLPLGDTGLAVELVRTDPQFPAVVLRIHHQNAPATNMILLADGPELGHDREHGIYGDYWCDASNRDAEEEDGPREETMLGSPQKPRIDVIQAPDGSLYYRAWKSPKLDAIGELPIDGTRVAAFEDTDASLTFYVESFVPHDRPGRRIKPGRFDKDKEAEQKVPQARVRLTVDGNTEQFWLEGMKPLIGDSSPQAGQRKVVAGSRRRVAVTLPRDRLDLGFHLYLRKFQRKLDPGTSMPSHYSSLVDVVAPDDEGSRKRVRENVLITLNEPGNFSDPRTGRSYRLYQSSFNGPFRPGHPYFDERVGGTGSRDELYLSILSVNYDPGRGLKYFGCLLIVVGIATMYYMKAYFFGKRPNRGGEDASPAAPP